MENRLAIAEHKLFMIMQHSAAGLAEIDRSGQIVYINAQGESLLKPVLIAGNLQKDNIYPILDHIAPELSELIRNSGDDAGNVLKNKTFTFSLSFGGEKVERHFSFTVTIICTDCIIIGFDDITSLQQMDDAIQDLMIDKAGLLGKFEIASNILHDIGNAMVGFGSYIARIRRILEDSKPENLQKLADFLSGQHSVMATALGEQKAEALINMINGIAESQKNNQEEIQKSIKAQLTIITHIQEVLNVQRQYVKQQDNMEKSPVKFPAIIEDCMSMLSASMEKRKIHFEVIIPEALPPITADRISLMQVMLNILKNSIEAIDPAATEKKISINVNAIKENLVVVIKDNGHGFDDSTKSQLFKRGFTTKASGSGLGLQHCRKIIENHEGSMTMTSDGFGKGAQTIIEFKI